MDQSNIVVHCANVEVEGMACMEAFATGCVPIVLKVLSLLPVHML